MSSIKAANGTPPLTPRIARTEFGMTLPARAEGSRSHGITRRSDARPGSRGKLDTGGSVAGSTGGEGRLARDALTNLPQRLLETGEPAAMKVAWEVRERAVGNVLI